MIIKYLIRKINILNYFLYLEIKLHFIKYLVMSSILEPALHLTTFERRHYPVPPRIFIH